MLGELILVLVISGVVIASLLAGLITLVRGLQPQAVMLNGEALPIAPTFGSFPSAVRLHQVFSDRVGGARAVYVFGGRHVSIPGGTADAQLRPLRLRALPRFTTFAPGLPMNARTFYELYASVLGEQETSATSDDFSVLVLGEGSGALAATCLVQVRRSEIPASEGTGQGSFVAREVRLWDAEAGEFRHAHAENAALAQRLFVGAIHTWMRHQPSIGVAEEGPTCLVFPDPWVYGGSRGRADDVPPFSRFSYFVGVSP